MWEFAKGMTQQERDRGFHKMDVYRECFNKTILNRKHSNALVTMPLKKMEPRYRDEVPKVARLKPTYPWTEGSEHGGWLATHCWRSRQLLCKRVEWLREMHTGRAAK
ncbi:hypothetical protein QBC45DRAFT_409510 [Copromyces sp. CBS 386.78]|nr:hypothetical protein QBC45DRAFT_409510 [Copromyces sp. CBS 386.78]